MNGNKKKYVEYKDIKYSNFKELCRAYDANYSIFMSRKKKGLSLEECLKYAKNKVKYNTKVTFRGQEYSSLLALCREYDANYRIVNYRKKQGLPLEECLEYATNRMHSITFRGKNYKSLKALCDEYDVNYTIVMNKKNKGLSLEESINIAKNRTRSITFKGQRYKNTKALCEAYGVSYDIFINRKSKGLPLEECLKAYKIRSDNSTIIILTEKQCGNKIIK